MTSKLKIHNILKFIFYAFIFGIFSFGKEFSKLGFNVGPGLYISEIVIVIISCLLGLEYTYSRRVRCALKNPISEFIFFFLIFCSIELVFSFHYYGTRSFRDSAIYYYSIFFVLSCGIFLTKDDIKQFSNIVLLASVVNVCRSFIQAFAGTIVSTSFGAARLGSGASGLYATISILLIILNLNLFSKRFIFFSKRFIPYLFISFNVVVIFFTAHRSFLVIWVILLISLYLSNNKKWNFQVLSPIMVLVFGILLALLIVFLIPNFHDIAYSTLIKYLNISNFSEANASSRLIKWNSVIEELLGENALWGVGFGSYNPIFWNGADVVSPHNSFLALLLKLGFFGFGIFILIFIYFVVYIVTFLRKFPNALETKYLFLCFVSITIMAAFNVVLEVPYMGVLFWIFMAITYRSTKLFNH